MDWATVIKNSVDWDTQIWLGGIWNTDLYNKKPSHVTHINQLLQLFEMIENKSCCAKQQKTW